MFIYKWIENEIIEKLCNYKYEIGGIVGGEKNTITSFFLDENPDESTISSYTPNIDVLNKVINGEWEKIDFLGFVHSHQCDSELSKEDVIYLRDILCATQMAWLLAGIVNKARRTLCWYKIERNKISLIEITRI